MHKSTSLLNLLRQRNNWSVEDAATGLGIDPDDYVKLESGESRITIDVAQKLSDLYRIDIKYFYADELPIVNYNNGDHSKSIFNTATYNDNRNSELEKELIEKLLNEKDRQIAVLKERL